MDTRKEVPELRWDGLSQIIAVILTLFLGIFVAVHKSGWFVLASALFGIVAATYLEKIPYGHLVPKGIRTGKMLALWQALVTWFRLVVLHITTWIIGARQGTAAREYLLRLVGLFSSLLRIVRKDRPRESKTMSFAFVLQSPVYYLRWGVIGLMMGVIIRGLIMHRGENPPPVSNQIPLALDAAIALLIGLSAFRDVMTDNSRRARTLAEEHLPQAILSRLLEIQVVEGMSEMESEGYVGDLRRAIEEARFRIGRFFSNGVVFSENLVNIAIVNCVLLLISPLAALLGIVAIGLTVTIVLRNLVTEREDEEPLYRTRARRMNLHQLAQHPDSEPLRESISQPGIFKAAIGTLDEEIRTITHRGYEEGRNRRYVARLVFFTLFGLSAIYPLHTAWVGDLRPRVALLYVFSMIGLWIAVSSAIEKAFRLVEGFNQLADVEEAMELLDKEEEKASTALDSQSEQPRLGNSSQIEFDEVRCAPAAFVPTVLRWPTVITRPHTIPSTVTIDNEVKVIGPPRSGRSLLLKLITGHISPTSGEIRIGGVPLSEISRTERRKRLILVPECPGRFSTFKVIELFQAFCGLEVESSFVRDVLGRFHLLQDFEVMGSGDYKGENLLIEWRSNRLSDQQTQLLWLALHYAPMKLREKDSDFRPLIIAVDGTHKLEGFKLRKEIVEVFRVLANDCCAKIITIARDQRELEQIDWVLTLIPPKDLPPDWEEEGSTAHVVAGGLHSSRFHSPDEVKKNAYRTFLKTQKEEA